MEKKRKPLQIYAILICVVAVVTLLINVSVIVTSAIDKGNPLMANSYSQSDLASLSIYKMGIMEQVQKDQAYIPSDDEIKEMYEAAKTDAINKVMHRSNRSIMVNSIVGVIALILFITHWLLMKKIERSED